MNQVSNNNNRKTLPPWLAGIVKRQLKLNKQYETAHDKLAEAYNDFLATIDDINLEYGTEFTFEQAATEFQGEFAFTTEIDDDD
jgi:hypothetical protein